MVEEKDLKVMRIQGGEIILKDKQEHYYLTKSGSDYLIPILIRGCKPDEKDKTKCEEFKVTEKGESLVAVKEGAPGTVPTIIMVKKSAIPGLEEQFKKK